MCTIIFFSYFFHFQLLFRCVSTLNYVGNSIFDSFSPYEINNQSNKTKKPPVTITSLFNCLIIDEAGQCIEIDNYIPLRLGINRIVLVGDPEQLYSSILCFTIWYNRMSWFYLVLRQYYLDEHLKLVWINRYSKDSINYLNTMLTIPFACLIL